VLLGSSVWQSFVFRPEVPRNLEFLDQTIQKFLEEKTVFYLFEGEELLEWVLKGQHELD
jgi:hypothetical protein